MIGNIFGNKTRLTITASCFSVCLFSLLLLFSPQVRGEDKITLSCDTFRYEIGVDGRNLALVDLADGRDYLQTKVDSNKAFCALVRKGEKTYKPKQVAWDQAKNVLSYTFDGIDATARVRVVPEKGRLVFEVLDVTGKPDAFEFINIPLKLKAVPDESFAACALSLNLHTHVHQLPALQTEYWSCCYDRFGFKGAKTALVGVPQKRLLAEIREVMTQAAPDVPFSDQGGAWALQAKEGFGSYLMNSRNLCEETVDDWIELCKTIGFNQISNHGGNPSFFLFGSFEMDKKRFPQGWQTFKKIVDKLHAAGISSILHTYSCYISPTAKYVTPVPSPDLDLLASFTLQTGLTADATEIVVKEPLDELSKTLDMLVSGYSKKHNKTLKIGNEIIRFEGVTKTAPYKFVGCKRGFHATKVSAHKAGDQVGLLKTFWGGLYLPEPHSALWEEVAKNHADVVNECGFDGIYFDAIEGIRDMWGEENYWYYGDKFVFDVMKYLKKPVGVEYAGMLHHWWHYRSRYQAWDRPNRGYKRFMDIHIGSMKAGEEYQHGCWQGYDPQIDKFASMKDCGLYLPLHLGWWQFTPWTSPKLERTLPDDTEYVCCKMLGNNAGLSMGSAFSKAQLDRSSAFAQGAALIRQYEELRHAHYFDERVLSQLRQTGKDFRLFKDANGKWNFKPVVYDQHKVCDLAGDTAAWQVNNRFEKQPVQIRIEPLMSAGAFNDPNRIVLTDYAKANFLPDNETAKGVSVAYKPVAGKESTECNAVFTATNTGNVIPEAAWGYVGKLFDKPITLGNCQAFGVWVHGDSSGSLLNLRIAGRKRYYGESNYFVKLDFSGWKYFELIEAESSAISHYVWPKTLGYFVYTNYRLISDPSEMDTLQVWFNGLKPGQETKCTLGPVVALPMVPTTIHNPTVVVNGCRLTFKTDMQTGMYLEFKSKDDCQLFDKNCNFVRNVPIEGDVPMLKAGANSVKFDCTSDSKVKIRARITVISEGKPL